MTSMDGPVRVLLVEDNDLDAALFVRLCRRTELSLEIEHIREPTQALDALLAGTHHLAVMDHSLGAMTGTELLRQALAQGAKPTAIMLTGSTSPEVADEALEVGASDFVHKGDLTAALLRRSIRYALARRRDRHELESLAMTDALTGLSNRPAFHRAIHHDLARARRADREISLLYLDLDGFKEVNDVWGHASGDEVLRVVAGRLTEQLRETDTVARLGGDEFAVLLTDLSRPEDGALTAQRVAEAIQQPISLQHATVQVGVSIGVATWPFDGDGLGELIGAADEAMYLAKAHGVPVLQASAELQAAAVARRALETRLRDALLGGLMQLVFQPRLCPRSRRIVGIEARVQLGEGGEAVRAGELLPTVHQLGLASALDRWVVETASATLVNWAGTWPDLRLTVNVSPALAASEAAAAEYARVLEALPIHPSRIDIHLSGRPRQLHHAAQWAKLGARLVLSAEDLSLTSCVDAPIMDDLTALELPFHVVRDCVAGRHQRAVVSATCALAKALDLAVHASGIEDVDQLAVLVDCGVSNVQGRMFGRSCMSWDARRAA